MGKVEIGNFYCLIGDNRILFLQKSVLNSSPPVGLDSEKRIFSLKRGEKRGKDKEKRHNLCHSCMGTLVIDLG